MRDVPRNGRALRTDEGCAEKRPDRKVVRKSILADTSEQLRRDTTFLVPVHMLQLSQSSLPVLLRSDPASIGPASSLPSVQTRPEVSNECSSRVTSFPDGLSSDPVLPKAC